MKHNNKNQFWCTLVLFSLTGQVAWVIENMYFNVFIYKMFHASAADISIMVGASAVMATLTTWLIGAYSDKIRKRKLFICSGYCLWGISILAFSLIRMDLLTPLAGSTVAAASLGVTLVIAMDCVMTFFGSSANDACFNAWLTDMGDESNRGRIEGINAMMPLLAILVVFGGFMAFDLDRAESWTMIYGIIGTTVIVIGLFGIRLIAEPEIQSTETGSFWKNVTYCFRPSVIKENPLLYVVTGAFAIFGISIQIFMPYLILYYEKTLHMEHYVLVMAPAIVLAAVITAVYGKNYDKYGFKIASIPTVLMLMLGYIFLYFTRSIVPVFVGSFLMMSGYLTGMAVFGAMIRDHIPRDKAGMFQGLRICGQVLIPGLIGPAIGAMVLKDAEQIVNRDGTTSFVPNQNIYSAAFVAAAILMIVLFLIFRMMNRGHYDLNQNRSESALDNMINGMQSSFSDERKERDESGSDRTTGWNRYPRPQLRRDSFLNLNGEWQLNGTTVQVPYAPESYLSGYHGKIGKHLNYKRTFELPEQFCKNRVILHFGAVDQIAEVFVNGVPVGKHEGGYLPFSMDITKALKKGQSNHTLEVRVTDPLSEHYPYGKQRRKRGGMWYTPVSGIWQTVWLESVPEYYITDLKLHPDLAHVLLELQTNQKSPADYRVEIKKENFHFVKEYRAVNQINIEIPNPVLWTPDSPELYDLKITLLGKEPGEFDVVESYFALRTIGIENRDGVNRVCLNHKPIFLNGVLDQGYYCDGIYLPATEQSYRQDILTMKQLGFNTLRKHIKIEPECFYYDCDRYGMLVMQDMVNNGHYSFFRDTVFPTFGKKRRLDTKKLLTSAEKKRRAFFIKHTKDTIAHLYNHPCIVVYTIFNEGWGQFHSDELYTIVKKLDPARLIDSTSGWFAQEKSDFDSMHIYYDEKELPVTKRPAIVSECGGYSYKVAGHVYSKYTHYGYGNCKSPEQLTDRMIEMYHKMIVPSIPQGLAGCIYTQLSDVEDETNGLLTYDRSLCKVDQERLKNMFEREIYSYFKRWNR